MQSRYYNPEMGRFINADDTAYLGTDGTALSYNLFAYCSNNPIMHKDPSGNALVGAIIGGAIGGALISTVSHITTNPNATVGSTIAALAVGAATGALGGLAGMVKSVRVAASVVSGVVAGTYAYFSTDGSTKQRIMTSVATGVITSLSTYGGAHLDTTGFDRFGTAVANYATTIMVGAIAEPVAVGIQQKIAAHTNPGATNKRWDWVRRKEGALLGI